MQNYWWILAIALSLLTSAYVYVNQFVKIKGSLLMVYRGNGCSAAAFRFLLCTDSQLGFLCLMCGTGIGHFFGR